MDDLCEFIECVCNSPQRFRLLDILDGTQMDVRGLMSALDSPRSTVQRNLAILTEQGWVEETRPGYTTTLLGGLLRDEFARANEATTIIRRMQPFFEAVDTPPEIDINLLADALVMTPESDQPTSLMSRLFTVFEGIDRVRGFLPVVSSLSVELSRRADAESVPECEYVISEDGFTTLYQKYRGDSSDGVEVDPPSHIDLQVYEGDLPYGLFVADEQFVLVAYNEVGRIQALVESGNEVAIEWAKERYEMYRQQSVRPHEADISTVAHDAEAAD